MLSKKNLLLLSSSRVGTTDYLSHALGMIKDHLLDVTDVLFIPYAGVTISYDKYTEMVGNALSSINVTVHSIHQFSDPVAAVKSAKAIVIGGGNTFQLLAQLYNNNLVSAIKEKVEQGTPYIGWSAGSNLACPTIKTTNDMPIICPPSFDALNFVPFQINPHYIHGNPPGHNGETREQRLKEFLELNSKITAVGLREGTMLKIDAQKINLIGAHPARIFKHQQAFYELTANEDFSFLM